MACSACSSHLKSFRIVEGQAGAYQLWARRIWLARTAWQQLLLLEELQGGGDQAGVHQFWARRIWLARTTWQQLLLPEELEDGGGQARVQQLLG